LRARRPFTAALLLLLERLDIVEPEGGRVAGRGDVPAHASGDRLSAI
jgi:hypothetical protein